MDKKIIKKIKQATVSLVFLKEMPVTQKECPFIIIGSGFCIHQRGVIITCKHVLEWFLSKNVDDIVNSIPDDEKKRFSEIKDIQSYTPNVIFYVEGQIPYSILTIVSPVEAANMQMDCDLAIIRIAKHKGYEGGYPTLDIESLDELYEGIDLGTCGFPLGNYLGEQIGSITSSITKGTLSSIIPSSSVSIDQLRYFQLDITATHGNSGGPVFNWNNGKVFGVLQRGVYSDKEQTKLLGGIAIAEPIYKIINKDEIKRILEVELEDFQK